MPDHWLAGRDRVRILGALPRQYSSHRLLLICFFTRKARCVNGSNTELPSPPRLTWKELCLADPIAIRTLLIAARSQGCKRQARMAVDIKTELERWAEETS